MKREFDLTGLIGLHGESLGGTVASEIAVEMGADFLFADRTFYRFDAVATS